MNKQIVSWLLILLVSSNAWSQGVNMVTLYEECNYGGKRYYLGVGNYNGYQMQIRNDRLSSVQVPYGMKLTIYENDRFKGKSNTYSNDVACLEPNWRNSASSIVIERDPSLPNNANSNDGVVFYNDCSYKGFSQALRPGSYNGSQLGQLKYNLSSFAITGNLSVKLYLNSENLGGISAVYETSTSCLPNNQSDNVGSLVIEYKKTIPQPGNGGYPGTGSGNQNYATFYADCDFNGNALRLGPGTYDAEKLGLFKYDISSAEVPSTLRVRAYTNSLYPTGNYSTISNDISCMTYNLNNRIGALVIEDNGYGGNNGNQYPDERVILYTDANYQGQSVSLTVGTWYNMQQAGFPDKALSSIQIPAGYRVVLYDQANARGNSTTLTTSRNDLSSGFGSWNDKVSSFVITRD